ncbi:MAG TPA: ABC transporter ATP-binding protein [Baekduia sp.]|nr:ABC transporter ATP-binding protein [Baekduia sp.]
MAWPDDRPDPAPLLEVEGLKAGYGPRTVVFEAGFRVRPGEVVAMMGHNGAGKSTTVKTVFGLVKPRAGTVRYAGDEITGHNCPQNVAAGMSYTPADSFVFADLTVSDNLKLGALSNLSEESRQARLEQVLALFPILAERASQRAGTFSGGQQRMLSIGIALMSDPKMMLLDEPSLGLSPALVEQVLHTIRGLADSESMGVLLVEQNMKYALEVADRVVIMHSGRIRLDASAEEMRERGQWWDLF